MKIDFEGIQQEIQQEILTILEDHCEKYPEVAKRLNYVGIPTRDYYKSSEMICHVSPYGNEMIITKKINNLEDESREKISGWTVAGGVKAKILHECGHLLDKCLQRSHCNVPASSPPAKAYRKGTRKLYQKYLDSKSSEVSLYARESQEEFVAEVYTQMVLQGNETNGYTKAFSDLLCGLVTEDFGEFIG